jgi:hypothetical protein
MADEFEPEFDNLADAVQDELLAQSRVVEQFGPLASRPRVDTLNGSGYANMKELRFDSADGVWRMAFAFDPRRIAILLAAGDKSGIGERQFYKGLIRKADARFAAHLARLEEKRRAGKKKAKKGK